MLTFSSNRPSHPSMWPLYALRSLVLWATIAGATVGVLFSVFGGTPVLLILAPLWAGFMVLAVGLIPAALLALLDVAFVGRRNRGTRRYSDPRPHRHSAQPAIDWALGGAVIGAGVMAGYSIVYLNAFSPTSRVDELVGRGLFAGTGAGLIVGWLTAVTLNIVDSFSPSKTLTQTIRRSGVVWLAIAAVIGAGLYVGYEPSTEKTLLPSALLALIGAGVVPQLIATAPTDPARIPDPLPTALSPEPLAPDAGLGEGARGDWRAAAPPQFPQQTPTRPNTDSTGTTTEVVNG